MSKLVSVFSAARRLGEQSGWTLTHYHMQKYLYLAHMFYLGRTGEPLVDGSFEAWEFGPVHPELHHLLKWYGAESIRPEALAFAQPVENEAGCVYLDAVVKQVPKDNLLAITHWEEGAWAKKYQPGAEGMLLSDASIMDEYRNRDKAANG